MIVTCILFGWCVKQIVLQGSMFRASVSDAFQRDLSFAEFVFLESFVSFHLIRSRVFSVIRVFLINCWFTLYS